MTGAWKMGSVNENDDGTWSYGTNNYRTLKEAQEAEWRENERRISF